MISFLMKFYLKPKTIKRSKLENLKLSVISKTYSKYINIPNKQKIFWVLWILDWISDRT